MGEGLWRMPAVANLHKEWWSLMLIEECPLPVFSDGSISSREASGVHGCGK